MKQRTANPTKRKEAKVSRERAHLHLMTEEERTDPGIVNPLLTNRYAHLTDEQIDRLLAEDA